MTKIPAFLALFLMSGTANAYKLQTVFNPWTGKLDYIAVSTTTSVTVPAGSDQQIQYNNGGSFGGAGFAYWDNVFNNLLIGGNSFVSTIPAIIAQDAAATGSLAIEVSTGTGSVMRGSVVGDAMLDFNNGTASPKLFIGKTGLAATGAADPVMTIQSAGSIGGFAVGIGTATPNAMLDIQQSQTSGSLLNIYNTNTGVQDTTFQLLSGFSSLANTSHIAGKIFTQADSSTGSRLILSATSSAGSIIEGIRVAATESIISTQGDQYGTVELHLQNRDGTNGALFSNAALDLVDFQFKPSAGNKGSVRYEHRGAFIVGAGNSSGEWQISTSNFSGTPIYAGAGTTEIVGNLGVNNASPAAALHVISATTNGFDVEFSTSTTSFHVAVSTSGHIITNSQSPSVSSCGITPSGSVVGDDNQGTISVGGGVVTSCTLTFAKSWGITPVCTIADNSTAITGDISSLSASAMTTSFSASLGGGLVYYRCGCYGASCL